MDKVQVVPIDPDISGIRFNPIWKDCIGEIIFYLPLVRVGQLVKQGQTIVNMETSRMITNIKAPLNGKVLEVNRLFLDNPCEMDNDTILFTFRESR